MNKDEMKTIEENEYEMIKRLQSALPDMETMRFNFDKIDLATYLYDTGCRKVGEDEIVIKRSELGKVVISHERADLVDMLNQEMREIQIANTTRQETAREILQELKQKLCEIHSFGSEKEMIDEVAKAYGIELED